MTLEPAARDQWYTLGALTGFPTGTVKRRLLSTDIVVTRIGDLISVTAAGDALPLRIDYGHL